MSAKTVTDVWKRWSDLVAAVLGLVQSGNRDVEEVCDVLQVIKNYQNFSVRLGIREMGADTKRQILSWQEFYAKSGIGLYVSGFVIPKRKEGFNRLIVVAQGLTSEKIYQAMKKQMPAWKYWDNLDSVESVRKTDKTYAIWVRDHQEADKELKSKSANDLKSDGTNCITLEERLLLEMMYFQETGNHLDIQNITLCAGSRGADGGVPGVSWGDGGVGVGWCYPGSAYGGLRGRSVVS